MPENMENHKTKPIRIAIPTNDGVTLFRGMLGRAKNEVYTKLEMGYW